MILKRDEERDEAAFQSFARTLAKIYRAEHAHG